MRAWVAVIVISLGFGVLGSRGVTAEPRRAHRTGPPEGYLRLVASGQNDTEALRGWCLDMVPRILLAAPECSSFGPTTPSSHALLVTGVGRSGTLYAQQLLTGAGFPVSHDSHQTCRDAPAHACPNSGGAVSWPHAFSDRPFTPRRGPARACPRPFWVWSSAHVAFEVVVHLVREPLKTIDSRWNLGQLKAFREMTMCNTDAELSPVRGAVEGLGGVLADALLGNHSSRLGSHFAAHSSRSGKDYHLATRRGKHHISVIGGGGGSGSSSIRGKGFSPFGGGGGGARVPHRRLAGQSPAENVLALRSATLVFTLQHWALWNLFVEAHANGGRVRVEDLPGRSLCGAPDSDGSLGSSLGSTHPPSCPAPEALNASAARLASSKASASGLNHDHTRHLKGGSPVTWALLAALDPRSARLAAHAAKRYGYASGHDLDEGMSGGTAAGITATSAYVDGSRRSSRRARASVRRMQGLGLERELKEECRFRARDARWTCALVRTGSESP